MFKLLLILGITAYVLYKVGSFIFKMGAASQHLRNSQSAPDNRKSKGKPNAQGEYIDYEEVK